MRVLFFMILLAGAGNAVLRPDIESPLTLYRMIAPLGLLWVFCVRPMLVIKGVGLFLLFFLYNFALARFYSSDLSQFLPSMVHYFYLCILLLMMMHLRMRYVEFDRSFISFAEAFYAFLFLNLLLEYFFGTFYPNLYEDEHALRAFFWNENDLAVVLCLFGWLVLSYDRYRGWPRALVLLLIVVVLYYNDSKAALVSLLLVSVPIWIALALCRNRRVSPGVWRMFFGGVAAAVAVVAILIANLGIVFESDTYTLGELLIRPIANILALESSGETWGSMNNRSDAAIFVIIEYVKSLGFGLGAGGSWLVLSLPQYELGGAKSPHNALLQFIVDFGYPVLVGYVYAAYWAVRQLFKPGSTAHTRLKIMAILSFPILGLSQSGAIVTNYMFFAVMFYALLSGRPVGATDRKSMRSPVIGAPKRLVNSGGSPVHP